MALVKYRKNRQNIISLVFNDSTEQEYKTRITIKNNMISFIIDEFIDLYLSYQVYSVSFNEQILKPVNISYEPDRLILTCYLYEPEDIDIVEKIQEIKDGQFNVDEGEHENQVHHIEDKKIFVSDNQKLLMQKTSHLVNSFHKKDNMYISNRYNGTIRSVMNVKYSGREHQDERQNTLYTRFKKHNERIYTFIFPLECADIESFQLDNEEFEILEISENKNHLSIKCNKITSHLYYNVTYDNGKVQKQNAQYIIQSLSTKIITNNQFINNIQNESLFLSSNLSIEMNVKNNIQSHFILLDNTNLNIMDAKYIYTIDGDEKEYILCTVNKIERSDYVKTVLSVMQNTLQWQ